MRASDFLRTLPPGGTSAEREAAVLAAVMRGDFIPPTWCEVRTEARGRVGKLYVSADTLSVGEPGDSVRVMVSATMAQRIADAWGWILPTVHLCDLINAQATVRVEPVLTPGDARMADYLAPDGSDGRMVEVSREIDRRIGGRAGLASSFSKDWVLSNRYKLGAGAVNVGFYSHKAPYLSHSGERQWQTPGTRHNREHVDYSQQYRAIRGDMLVDGVSMRVADVLMSRDLSELVSDEGALAFCRHPGVPLEEAAP